MKIDGINLINDSSVKEARIENGASLPSTNAGDEGRMFWLKRSYGDYIAGLYVSDGVQWNYTNDNEGLTTKFKPTEVNMDATVESNSVVLVDTTMGGFQVTLPATPEVGDFVYVIDTVGKFSNNNVTVVRNGAPIRGVSENLKIKANNAFVTMFFAGGVTGWTYTITN